MSPDSPRPTRARTLPTPVFDETPRRPSSLTHEEERDVSSLQGGIWFAVGAGATMLAMGAAGDEPGLAVAGGAALIVAAVAGWHSRHLLRLARLQRRVERHRLRGEFKAREAELLAALEAGRPTAGRVSLADAADSVGTEFTEED